MLEGGSSARPAMAAPEAGSLGKWLHAHLFLGAYVGRHFLLKLLPGRRRRRGALLFRECFYPEGLRPVTPQLRDLLPRAESCVGCDLCLLAAMPPGKVSPRDLVLGVARSSSSWALAAPALADPEDYRAAEPLCPVRVPFATIAAAIGSAVQ